MSFEQPDIYNIEFNDVYEIDFADVDHPSNAPDPTSPPPHTAVSDVVLQSALDHHPESQVSTSENNPDSQEQEILTGKVVPPLVLESASRAITELLAVTTKSRAPVAQLSKIAFKGMRIMDSDFKSFLDALNCDPRIQYQGGGEYLICERATASSSLREGELVPVDVDHLMLLADSTVRIMAEKPGDYQQGQILGIANSFGDYLTLDEANEFFALLATHPNLIALEHGGYDYKADSEFTPITRDFAEKATKLNRQADTRSMKPQQISRVLKSMKNTPEYRKAYTQAKRVANPRRRTKTHKKSVLGPISGGAHKKSYMGKAHGKKVTIESLLEDKHKAA